MRMPKIYGYTQKGRIESFLKNIPDGATIEDLQDFTGASRQTVRRALEEWKLNNLAKEIDGRWFWRTYFPKKSA